MRATVAAFKSNQSAARKVQRLANQDENFSVAPLQLFCRVLAQIETNLEKRMCEADMEMTQTSRNCFMTYPPLPPTINYSHHLIRTNIQQLNIN